MSVCNVRQLNGPLRCEADFNHEGDHWAIVNKKHIRWENRLDKPTRSLGGRTSKKGPSLRKQTPKQDERTAFLHGIKAERMYWQAESRGTFLWWCETCKREWHYRGDAWEALTVSHIEPRNDTSTRYERRREPDFRGDDPSNILLECVSCNQAREPQPEFTGSSK